MQKALKVLIWFGLKPQRRETLPLYSLVSILVWTLDLIEFDVDTRFWVFMLVLFVLFRRICQVFCFLHVLFLLLAMLCSIRWMITKSAVTFDALK